MKVIIYVPLPRGTTRGNWITALRWADILRRLDHAVTVLDPSEFDAAIADDCDLLIALHARRSHAVVKAYREASAGRPVVVALTGTDLQSDFGSGTERHEMVLQSLELADRIVLLEPEGLKLLPSTLRHKCSVILQSSSPVPDPPAPDPNHFQIAVLAHLREVKDPFLIAKAAQLLPVESRIRILHLGGATSERWESLAVKWTQECDRYEWRGAVPHPQARETLAASHLTVLTSRQEGGPSVFSEASVCGVPIVSTRIDAAIGILSSGYPGLFDVGNPNQLADLLWKAESDAAFYSQLVDATVGLRKQFSYEAEAQSWRRLMACFSA